MDAIEVGELLYEYTVKLAGMTEYGVSFASLMAGTAAPPPEGAVNGLQVWGTGTVDLGKQVVPIKGYSA